MRSSASWKVIPDRLTVAFLSRKPSSNSTLTPAMRPRLSRIFCRLPSSKRIVIGTGLRGDSTGSGVRAAAWARAFVWSKAARSSCSSCALADAVAHELQVVRGRAVGGVVVARDLELLGGLLEVARGERLAGLVVVEAARLDARVLERDLVADVLLVLLERPRVARHREVPLAARDRVLRLAVGPARGAARGRDERDHDHRHRQQGPPRGSRHSASHRLHHSLYGVPASDGASEELLTS